MKTHSLPSLQSTTKTPSPSSTSQFAALGLLNISGLFIGCLLSFCIVICQPCLCANVDDEPPRRGMQRATSSPPSNLSPRSNMRKGLDPVTIRALPVYSYCGDAEYQSDCTICLGKLEKKEFVKILSNMESSLAITKE
ncbi:uncharacterized protein LOC133876728 [Alnus glutinosa]|uniref:uncharacterized protein LOC133876728 n=1 Tax=Alnus glutinosa TaxID=3517 RepID=UPI002D7668D2|nr:uncharacterized protein LOC133876728 [Alnus glutinosa]